MKVRTDYHPKNRKPETNAQVNHDTPHLLLLRHRDGCDGRYVVEAAVDAQGGCGDGKVHADPNFRG